MLTEESADRANHSRASIPTYDQMTLQKNHSHTNLQNYQHRSRVHPLQMQQTCEAESMNFRKAAQDYLTNPYAAVSKPEFKTIQAKAAVTAASDSREKTAIDYERSNAHLPSLSQKSPSTTSIHFTQKRQQRRYKIWVAQSQDVAQD